MKEDVGDRKRDKVREGEQEGERVPSSKVKFRKEADSKKGALLLSSFFSSPVRAQATSAGEAHFHANEKKRSIATRPRETGTENRGGRGTFRAWKIATTNGRHQRSGRALARNRAPFFAAFFLFALSLSESIGRRPISGSQLRCKSLATTEGAR